MRELADVREIAAHLVDTATLGKLVGVVGQRGQRGQRLVQLMCDAGGHLAQHGQLAGLHGGIARLAQDALRGVERLHLGGERRIGRGQLGGALGNARLQVALDFSQRGAGTALLLVPPRPQPQRDAHRKGQRRRKRSAGAGHQRGPPLVARIDQHGNLPAEQADRPILHPQR